MTVGTAQQPERPKVKGRPDSQGRTPTGKAGNAHVGLPVGIQQAALFPGPVASANGRPRQNMRVTSRSWGCASSAPGPARDSGSEAASATKEAACHWQRLGGGPLPVA